MRTILAPINICESSWRRLVGPPAFDRRICPVSQSLVSKFERGERRLDVVELLEVAQALGVDPIQLLRELDRT